MTKIYLIRHCEAEGNIYRRAQGWYDGLPTPKGRRQAAALAEWLRDTPLDALYSSDLARTVCTAEALQRYHKLPLRTDPRLREQNLGAWEDVPFGNLAKDFPKMLYNFNNDPGAFHARDSESFSALQTRIYSVLKAIAERNPGKTVAVVSHGMVIRAFLARVQGLSSREMLALPHGDNTAVSLLEYQGGAFRVAYANDASHLTGALSTFARQSWWQNAEIADDNNVYFQRLDPQKYPRRYLGFYEKTWKAVHGNLQGFRPELYLDAAIEHTRSCPDALVMILRPDGEAVGVTELDTERARAENAGWICLCFVEEPYRRQLLGVQLIGHAVSLFRRMGRRSVRLNVFEGNTGAIRFYESCEFHAIGENEGVSGRLLVMEKLI